MTDKKEIEKWIPLEGVTSGIRMYIEGLHNDYEGFRLLLRGESCSTGMLKLDFSWPLSYRSIDEGDYLTSMEYEEYNFPWPFYKTQDSEYIDRFIKESSGKERKKGDITHYCVYTPNDCLDILMTSEPKSEWL